MTHRKDVVTWADIMAMPLDQIPKGDPFARGNGPADPLRERAMAGALAAPQLAARVRELETECDEARAQLAELAPKVFITQLERGEIRHVAYVAGGFYTREAIAEWAKKALGFERADEIRRLTLPDHKHFPPMAGGEPR